MSPKAWSPRRPPPWRCERMELRQLRYFVAVARNESFKKAAIELHIAQPALSRQIGLLEHELTTTLFTRHTRGSFPTEDGLMLLEDAARILHLTEQVKQRRSDVHTSDLQSLMRISFAVFCLKKIIIFSLYFFS